MRDASFGMAARGRKSKAAMHMPMRAVFFVAVGGGAWFEQKPAAGKQRRRGGRGGTPRMQRKAYGTGGRCVEVIHGLSTKQLGVTVCRVQYH